LPELAIAVVIVMILLVLALPSYQRHLFDTRRALAGAALQEARMRQEQYFLDYKRYAGRLTDLGFPSHPYAIDREGNAVAGDAPGRLYLIGLETVENSYTLSAAPQLDQAADLSCGTLHLDAAGARRASGTRPGLQCW